MKKVDLVHLHRKPHFVIDKSIELGYFEIDQALIKGAGNNGLHGMLPAVNV